MFTRLPLLAALLAVVVLAGCTTRSEGSPSPAPTSENQTSDESPAGEEPDDQELPYAGAPAVDNPLDTARYQQDPCQSLTAAQAEALNLVYPGEAQDGALGKACRFGGRTDARARVYIAFHDRYPFGLSAVYQANEDGKLDVFEPLPPIEGYPAVVRAGTDDRPNGGCTIDVGASDEITFEVAVLLAQQYVGTKDPCESAVLVTGEVLRTMKSAP